VGVKNCFIQILNFRNEVVKQFITLTKTMKKLTECDGAEAQASV
jgi:hypothetical protein